MIIDLRNCRMFDAPILGFTTRVLVTPEQAHAIYRALKQRVRFDGETFAPMDPPFEHFRFETGETR